jgi:chemotaxis protein methyltransferase CheR
MARRSTAARAGGRRPVGISQGDFDFVARLVSLRLGIRLEKDKGYLVESRFRRICERLGLRTVGELVDRLRAGSSEALVNEALEALTTNETYFFRDGTPFEALKGRVLPALVEARRGDRALNVWSAACATGQEPYSIAMAIREAFPQLSDWNVQIFATDVANAVLEKARSGLFSQAEVGRGLSPDLLRKYFAPEGQAWRLREETRRMVKFWPLNLCRDWPVFPRMDVIFLRNVLIYMDEPEKRSILARAHKLLRPDGFLFLGAAESTFNLADFFRRMDADVSGCFRPIP